MKNKIHVEILDKKRQKILEKISKLFSRDYYLAGGIIGIILICM